MRRINNFVSDALGATSIDDSHVERQLRDEVTSFIESQQRLTVSILDVNDDRGEIVNAKAVLGRDFRWFDVEVGNAGTEIVLTDSDDVFISVGNLDPRSPVRYAHSTLNELDEDFDASEPNHGGRELLHRVVGDGSISSQGSMIFFELEESVDESDWLTEDSFKSGDAPTESVHVVLTYDEDSQTLDRFFMGVEKQDAATNYVFSEYLLSEKPDVDVPSVSDSDVVELSELAPDQPQFDTAEPESGDVFDGDPTFQ